MQSWEQIDLTAKVQTVRRKTRPWKAIIALLFAIVAAVVSYDAREHKGFFHHIVLSDLVRQFVWPGSAIAFCALASIATYGMAGKARQILEPRAGTSHAAVVQYAVLIIGAFTTLVITLELFGVPIGQLVLGGALTSVFVGIAAQQALSNVFAGLVLLFAHPFRVGDTIRLRAGALGGQLEGTVTDIGITYVRLDSGGSIMAIPNSQVLNAVVGPVPAGEDAIPPAPPAPVTQAQTTPAPQASVAPQTTPTPQATPALQAPAAPQASTAPRTTSTTQTAQATSDTPVSTASPAASGNPAAGIASADATEGAAAAAADSTEHGTSAQTGTSSQDGASTPDRADKQPPSSPPA